MVANKTNILLVEDSEADIEAIYRASKAAGWEQPLYHCWTEEESLDYLHQRGVHADPASAPRPGLVILDWNLPGTDGREVLADVKADESLKCIPLVILTTSGDERDVQGCFRAGAICYL